jgi:zinc transport system substrate-binding protein
MVALTRAKLYVQVGSGIEFELSWMDKLIAVNEEMLVVDSSKGAKVIEVAGEDAHEREGAVEPHIWLSPLNAKVMVQNIYESLVQVDSVNKSYYEQNRDAYLQRLTELDQDISNDLSGVTNRSFMVYHPAFVYFSEAYNLTIFSIEAAGKEPTAAGLVYLIEQAREHNIKVILASPQFNPQSSEVIAKAIDGTVAFVDPLARGYIRNMRLVLSEMVSAME